MRVRVAPDGCGDGVRVCSPSPQSSRLCWQQQVPFPAVGQSLARRDGFSPRVNSALVAASPCPRGDGGFIRLWFWLDLCIVGTF